MNGFKLKYTVGIIISITVILFSGCSTINHLDQYDIRGSAIAMDMMVPPEPSVDVDYGNVDFGGNQLMAIVQFGTNIVKAGEAGNAEAKLRKALNGLYIPEYAAELTFDRIVRMLDGKMLRNGPNKADIILEIDIEQYGLEAYSYSGNVSMVFEMTARFYHPADNRIIWQRNVNVSREITPGVFGFDQIIGNVVTIASLGNLDEKQLSEGFQKMTQEIMQETINYLKEDLREARRK